LFFIFDDYLNNQQSKLNPNQNTDGQTVTVKLIPPGIWK